MSGSEQAKKLFFQALSFIDSSDFQNAEMRLRDALVFAPGNVSILTNLATALLQQDKVSEAREFAERGVSANASDVEALLVLGDCLAKEEKLSEALACYKKCIAFNPTIPEPHNNCGSVQARLGHFSEATDSFDRAIALDSNFGEAHANLGRILLALGKLDRARTHCEQAIKLNPNIAEGYLNLAKVLLADQQDPARAFALVTHALKMNETNEARNLFGDSFLALRPTVASLELQNLAIRALSEAWKPPRELSLACIRLIKQEPALAVCIARASAAWPRRLPWDELFGSSGLHTAAADPLLRCLLECTPVVDCDMERFLSAVRFSMLRAAEHVIADDVIEDDTLYFYCALARQCFINEYVFSYTDAEFEQAQHLRGKLLTAMSAGASVPTLWLIAVAAYFPLQSLAHSASLLDRTCSDPVGRLLVQHIREPVEERSLRDSMPRLTAIDDDVSLLVKQQYEENPYPRWIKTASPIHSSTDNGDKRNKRSRGLFSRIGGGTVVRDILIAGCGTGLQAIVAAREEVEAHVLAVDLSLASLSYAKRQARSLGVTTIEFAQADILKLGSIDRTFDAIVSTGVLHHLADPYAGWRVLLSLLRPGGSMCIGLYSTHARRDITAAQKYVRDRNFRPTADDIRRSRQELMTHGKGRLGFSETLLLLEDFFSMSECRDLLFHVQERGFTIPEINKFISDNNLKFIQFVIGDEIRHLYRRRFPSDPTMTNLDLWHIFEMENPYTFLGMYNFWLQKAKASLAAGR